MHAVNFSSFFTIQINFVIAIRFRFLFSFFLFQTRYIAFYAERDEVWSLSQFLYLL